MSGYLSFIYRQWPLLLFGFITVFWGNLGQSFFLSWYGPSIQQSLELSASEYGLIYAIATLCSGGVIMLVGHMIDRFTLLSFTMVTALILMIASILMFFINSVLGLFISLFLLRLAGQGLMPHTAHTTMTRYFDLGRGKAVSLASSGVPLGEMFLPVLIVMSITFWGWKFSWLVFAATIPLFYFPLVYWLLMHSKELLDSKPLMRKKKNIMGCDGLLNLFGDWHFWTILPSVLAGPFIVTGIFIQQGFLLEQKGWSASWFSYCFILYGAVHWFSAMIAGSMVDKFKAYRLLPFIMWPLFFSVMSFAWLDSVWSAMLSMILLGGSMGVSGPVIGSLWAEIYGVQHLGAIRSFMTALMMFSTAAAPWLFGVLIDIGLTDTVLFSYIGLFVFFSGILVLRAYPMKLGTC